MFWPQVWESPVWESPAIFTSREASRLKDAEWRFSPPLCSGSTAREPWPIKCGGLVGNSGWTVYCQPW